MPLNQRTRSPRPFSLRHLAITGSVALVVACGGGGAAPPGVQFPAGVRVGTPSPAADITSTNFVAVGTPVVQAILTALGGGGAAPLANSRESALAVDSSGRHSVGSPSTFVRRGVERSLALLAAPAPPEREKRQAISGGTLVCSVAGSVAYSYDDADGNLDLSAGDRIVFDFLGCVDAAGEPALNGAMALGFNIVELSAPAVLTGFDVSASFTNLSVQRLGTLNGTLQMLFKRLNATTVRTLESYVSMQASFGTGVTDIYDFDIDTLADAATASPRSSIMHGAITVAGQRYALAQTNADFNRSTLYPTLGALRVRDATGDFIDVTARGAGVDLDFYLATSPGQPAAALHDEPWQNFLLAS